MRISKIFKCLMVLALITGVAATSIHAQAGRGKGRLKIRVKDENKAPMEGVMVKIKFETRDNSGIEHKGKTNKKGEVLFGHLGKGFWRILATADGYVPDRQRLDVKQYSKNPIVKMTLKKAEAVAAVKSAEPNLMEKGNALFEEGKYEEALEAYKEFQTKSPDFNGVKINISNCLIRMEKYDEALAELNKFLEVEKEATVEIKAQCLASIGTIYMKRNDMESAQKYFMQSLELNPKDEILAYNVGEIFFSNNKNEEAIKYFEIAMQVKPDWSTPQLKLGYVYLNLGNMKKAGEHFKKFVEMDPDNPQTPAIQDLIKSLKDM